MTVGKMLRYYGGLEDTLYRAMTYLDRADLIRVNPDLVTRSSNPVDIGRILDGLSKDVNLLPGDELRVLALAEVRFLEKTVQIAGRVKRPGEYRLTEGMTLTDLVLAAGGYTKDAWTKEAEIARVLKRTTRGDSLVQIIHAKLPELLDTSRAAIEVIESDVGQYLLEDKDQVFVRPDPNYRLQETVTILGEVMYPGTYALASPKARISTIVERAGGLRPTAYARAGQLDRNGVRFRTNFEEALSNPGGIFDALLHPGDRIVIGRAPNSVEVLGEVNNPGRYSFVRGRDLKFYIENAGGLTDSADYALVSYPEGFVEQAHFTFLLGDNPTIPDGSAIVVKKVIPEPPEPVTTDKQTSTFDFIKDVVAVVVSSLTMVVLASKL
jgi:protein involved in polysaccharide export with SLBB domain